MCECVLLIYKVRGQRRGAEMRPCRRFKYFSAPMRGEESSVIWINKQSGLHKSMRRLKHMYVHANATYEGLNAQALIAFSIFMFTIKASCKNSSRTCTNSVYVSSPPSPSHVTDTNTHTLMHTTQATFPAISFHFELQRANSGCQPPRGYRFQVRTLKSSAEELLNADLDKFLHATKQ